MIWYPAFATFHVWKNKFSGIFIIGSKFGRLLMRANPGIGLPGTVRIFPLSDPISAMIRSVCAPFHYSTFINVGLNMIGFSGDPICIGEFVFIIKTKKLFNIFIYWQCFNLK